MSDKPQHQELLDVAYEILRVKTDGIPCVEYTQQYHDIVHRLVLGAEMAVLSAIRDGTTIEELALMNMQRRSCFVGDSPEKDPFTP